MNTTELFKRYKKYHGYNCKDVKSKREREKILKEVFPKIVEDLCGKKRTACNIKKIDDIFDVLEKRQDIVPLLIGYGFRDTLVKYLDKVKTTFFFPSKSLGRNALKLFEEYKDMTILKIEINREPVNRVIQTVLNLITFGGFEKAKKSLSFDDIFHLYMILEFEDGNKLKIEKNQKINIERLKTYKMENDQMMITVNRPLTLGELFKNAIDTVGAYQFYIYSAFKNNCQRFVMDILESNKLGNPEIYKYVLQDAGYILENNPSFLRSIAQFSTDTAAKLQELFGLGISRENVGCNNSIVCECLKCRYSRLKDAGYYITYDITNRCYKYRFEGKSIGTSSKMDKNDHNLADCISYLEEQVSRNQEKKLYGNQL
jgi:hypothetical protein